MHGEATDAGNILNIAVHRLLKAQGGARGRARVALIAKEDQQRIAAKRDQIAAVILNHLDQDREDLVQAGRDHLGAFAAQRAQPLGQRGRAGEIGEQQRAFDPGAARGFRDAPPAAAG